MPGLQWHPGRVSLVLTDHPDVDAMAVAGRCADWIAFQAERVTDGPATFRRFMEKARREPHLSIDIEFAEADAYDVFFER